jgi:hypothetical protein
MVGSLHVLSARRGKRDPVRGRDTDCRRAPDDHRADRVRHLGRSAARDVDLFERQPPLVEEDDAVVLEPQDPLRLEHARRRARGPAATGRGRTEQR